MARRLRQKGGNEILQKLGLATVLGALTASLLHFTWVQGHGIDPASLAWPVGTAAAYGFGWYVVALWATFTVGWLLLLIFGPLVLFVT